MSKQQIPIRVGTRPVPTRSSHNGADAEPEGPAARAGPHGADAGPTRVGVASDAGEWRERAMRLQAEMDNYRKRQRRLAQEQARAEQERLLLDVLSVADNLERTLSAASSWKDAGRGDSPSEGTATLQQGVELTRAEMMRVLSKYGVERLEAKGAPFDPAWHEAVHTVPARAYGVQAGTVVDVVRSGYRYAQSTPGRGAIPMERHSIAPHSDGALLRPAQVVVAL